MKIFYQKDVEQVNVLDERFYTDDGGENYYPSVTEVLSAFPKGKYYELWLMKHGVEGVKRELAESSIIGTNVHDAIYRFYAGEEVRWFEEEGNENYTELEWKMISRYMEFHAEHKPKVVASEHQYCSKNMRIGGTMDMVCEINGELWLIDHKTSVAVRRTHEIQLAVYAQMWNEFNDRKIERLGVMWLKSLTRGPAKDGKAIQGKGWKLHEVKDVERCLQLYTAARTLWDEINPNYKPKNLEYPNIYKL